MKFVKGMLLGTMISAGVVMMYNDNMNTGKKRLMKKGKKLAKKMGIL